MFEYISTYGIRYRYAGELLPKGRASWQRERYLVLPETEIAVVLLAAEGFSDWDAARYLCRPIGEVGRSWSSMGLIRGPRPARCRID